MYLYKLSVDNITRKVLHQIGIPNNTKATASNQHLQILYFISIPITGSKPTLNICIIFKLIILIIQLNTLSLITCNVTVVRSLEEDERTHNDFYRNNKNNNTWSLIYSKALNLLRLNKNRNIILT